MKDAANIVIICIFRVNQAFQGILIYITELEPFILIFKEFEILRSFFNHIYWSFFVKSYYTYILVSGSVIMCVLYLSESVIIMHIYNIILYSCINFIFIFIIVIIIYSCFELPLKKIFKYFLIGNDIIDEEDNEEEEEEEEEKENEEINDNENDTDEFSNLKNNSYYSS